MTYKTLLFLLLTVATTLLPPGVSAQNTYCDPADCLFWLPQPEEIDSAVITYGQNLWSIDEWDNGVGCIVPIFNVNQCENLDMVVYYPKLQPGEKRPLVLLIHGGGFVSGDYTAFLESARNLAKLGYVAATINYRLCKRNNCLVMAATGCANLCNTNFTADLLTGAYVAALDANNAIRYLQQNADQYHVDPENIIVGGHSAGAWTAMNVAFMDQAEANAINPQWQGVWGDLNPVTGLKGVICLSGAVVDTSLIDADENYPVFVLHGTCDPTVCYDYDAAFHCNSSYPKVYGGLRIAKRQRDLGHAYYLFSALGMGHDIGPLAGQWIPELFRYMRTAMLCGNFIQKHSSVILSPNSAECTLLQFDIPGCNLQFNHPQFAPGDLPITQSWGGYPAPCGNGAVAVSEPLQKHLISLYPTLVHDFITLEVTGDEPSVEVSIFNAQGQEIWRKTLQQKMPERIDMQHVPAGVYFIRAQTPVGRGETLRIVRE